MTEKKTKIVLDADVLLHFAKGERLSLLPDILKEYQFVVLDKVYDEVSSIHNQLDNQILFLKNITKISFSDMPREVVREYARLATTFGRGESACMAYCHYYNDVVGSSNTKDIKDYCTENGITFLTTIDFLYLAYVRKLMTSDECKAFIETVRNKGSHGVPETDITTYVFKKEI
ncbi:MAG: hypothetical protein IJT98_03520 [Prevotella sp.]|nr:hypothetical protein [Prevotella sp.]